MALLVSLVFSRLYRFSLFENKLLSNSPASHHSQSVSLVKFVFSCPTVLTSCQRQKITGNQATSKVPG